ncbi:MAG: chemotaxis protein CheW [Pseudomonadales bacterium]|nr:chemotaxis protein CheW [Pseudomonadales bacterium]
MNSVAEVKSESLSCLMLPVGDTHLLVPNVTVAEILPWRKIRKWSAAPEWCLGLFNWRGQTVPVVRYEKLNGSTTNFEVGHCILIMNRSQNGTAREFYALAVDGMPRLVHLGNDDLENRSKELKVADSAHLQIGLDTATIPRLSYFEEQVGMLPGFEEVK